MAEIGQTALLAGALAIKPRVLVGSGGVGPSRPWPENSSSTPRPSASCRRPKNAPRSAGASPAAGPATRKETPARSRSSAAGRGSSKTSRRRIRDRRSPARRTSETTDRTPAARPTGAPSGSNTKTATGSRATAAPAQSRDGPPPRKAPQTRHRALQAKRSPVRASLATGDPLERVHQGRYRKTATRLYDPARASNQSTAPSMPKRNHANNSKSSPFFSSLLESS